MEHQPLDVSNARQEMGLPPVVMPRADPELPQPEPKRSLLTRLVSWIHTAFSVAILLGGIRLAEWVLVSAGYDSYPDLFSAKGVVYFCVFYCAVMSGFWLLERIVKLLPLAVQKAIQGKKHDL